jgi:alkylation response protein AidB-like acyl-CoA dehydrogenase
MLPLDHSQAGAFGVADTENHLVSGIATGDILLACWAWEPGAAGGADPTGIDVSEATVGNGTVALSTTSTAGKWVWFVWAKPAAA